MKNLNVNELCEINAGGAKDVYVGAWSIITGLMTGGNGYAMTAAGMAAAEHYDYLEKTYKNYKFDAKSYVHPYRSDVHL